MAGLTEVMIERHFAAAHRLRGHKGKCDNLHGHNYRLEIYARGRDLNDIGLLIDFSDLRKIADGFIGYVDHRNLNDLPPFDEELNPSAENIARFVLEYMNSRIEDERIQVWMVKCFETETSTASFQLEG
jgi:6-pyruvoyltetrahydropterin/6-carboxytetrahydropterin synthase